jgi:hypothetical protein
MTEKQKRTMTKRAGPPDPVISKMRLGTPTKDAVSQSGKENATSCAAAPRIWMSMMGMKRPVQMTRKRVPRGVCDGRVVV